RLAAAEAGGEALRSQAESDLEAARRRHRDELQVLREERDRRREEAELLRRELDDARREGLTLSLGHETLTASVEALEAAHARARLELDGAAAQGGDELAAAERRAESAARRVDELCGEIEGLHAELQRLHWEHQAPAAIPGPGAGPNPGTRVHVAEVATVRPR